VIERLQKHKIQKLGKQVAKKINSKQQKFSQRGGENTGSGIKGPVKSDPSPKFLQKGKGRLEKGK